MYSHATIHRSLVWRAQVLLFRSENFSFSASFYPIQTSEETFAPWFLFVSTDVVFSTLSQRFINISNDLYQLFVLARLPHQVHMRWKTLDCCKIIFLISYNKLEAF